MLRVACDEEAIIAIEIVAQDGKAVIYRLYRIVLIVDALRSRGCGEVLVCGLLAVVSCWAAW